jgi:hypothetical protein
VEPDLCLQAMPRLRHLHGRPGLRRGTPSDTSGATGVGALGIAGRRVTSKRVRQAFCVNGRFFLAPQAICGRWKSGNPGFGFPLFHGPHLILRFSLSRLRLGTTGFRPSFWAAGALFRFRIQGSRLSSATFRFAAMPTRLAGPGRLAESQNAARLPSNSVPASSTSWQYAPAPGTAVSSPHPHSEMIRAF